MRFKMKWKKTIKKIEGETHSHEKELTMDAMKVEPPLRPIQKGIFKMDGKVQ